MASWDCSMNHFNTVPNIMWREDCQGRLKCRSPRLSSPSFIHLLGLPNTKYALCVWMIRNISVPIDTVRDSSFFGLVSSDDESMY